MELLVKRARETSGLAAYHYFFLGASSSAQATYLAALEAETEAELLLAALRGDGSPGA